MVALPRWWGCCDGVAAVALPRWWCCCGGVAVVALVGGDGAAAVVVALLLWWRCRGGAVAAVLPNLSLSAPLGRVDRF